MSDTVVSAASDKVDVKAPRVGKLREELEAEEKRLEALLAPAREVYEKLINNPELIKARNTIKEVSRQLVPIKNELAQLRKKPNGKTLKADTGTYSGEVK